MESHNQNKASLNVQENNNIVDAEPEHSDWNIDELVPATLVFAEDTPPSTMLNMDDVPALEIDSMDPDESTFLATICQTSRSLSAKSEPSEVEQPSLSSLEDHSHSSDYNKFGFSIGLAVDKNRRYRRTMEDAHCYFGNFNETRGSGFFGIFDGHAGKGAADFCQDNLHLIFQKLLNENPNEDVCEVLNKSFLEVDNQLSQKEDMYAGTTVIVAFLRIEEVIEKDIICKRRVLYTANAGDARAVLSRNGIATRLSYDHKGSDPSESQRVQSKGGFMLNNRVNGVLAVTRSLGDHSMKEWVIGNPFTTKTVLNASDSWLILACDGVWDVCSDQDAINLLENETNAQSSAQKLLDYSLEHFSTDNLSILAIKLNNDYDLC